MRLTLRRTSSGGGTSSPPHPPTRSLAGTPRATLRSRGSLRSLIVFVLSATSLLFLPQLAEAQGQRRVSTGRPVVGQAVPRPPIATPGPGRGYSYGYGRPYYPYHSGYYPYRYSYYPYAWGGWGYPYYPYGSFGFSIGFGFGYGYPVSFGVGFGYPGFYNPWYGYPYGPYPPAAYPYAYGGYMDGRTSALRIDGDRVDAEVYIDGYLAGRVDDYDGNLQRLYLEPGQHELTVYRDGYHTVREQLYLNPGATKTLRFNMEPLGPGETAERPPAPVERTERGDPARRVEPQDPMTRPYTRDPAPSSRYGTLSLRVQPSDAEIIIDGERWSVTAGEARIAIELSPGLHRLEIRKEGYEAYAEDIAVRDGRLLPLNVSLKKKLALVNGAKGQ